MKRFLLTLLFSASVVTSANAGLIRPNVIQGTVTGKFSLSENKGARNYVVFAYQGVAVDANAFRSVEIGDCVRITAFVFAADKVERLEPSDPVCNYVVERIK